MLQFKLHVATCDAAVLCLASGVSRELSAQIAAIGVTHLHQGWYGVQLPYNYMYSSRAAVDEAIRWHPVQHHVPLAPAGGLGCLLYCCCQRQLSLASLQTLDRDSRNSLGSFFDVRRVWGEQAVLGLCGSQHVVRGQLTTDALMT